jgi:SAM-dependent methyltransferase
MNIARYLIDSTVSILGFLLQRRTIPNPVRKPNGQVCVNLGCGLAVAPGWTNVDASLSAFFAGTPKILLNLLYRASGANRYYSKVDYCRLLAENSFVFHDLSRSLPFANESIDFFYSSHFFEHLFPADAVRLLKEMHGALKFGGIVRIAVPDLAIVVRLYDNGEKKRFLDDYFFVNDFSSYLARHKYMYDFELISNLLFNTGFRNIRRCAYGEGSVPDLLQLDNRPDDTMFVEAVR